MRKRRYLIGVAASAIALISLIGAGTAGAAQFATEEPASVSATPQSESLILPKAQRVGLYCKTMSLSGSTTASRAETVTMTPVIAGCSWGPIQNFSMATHGCQFVLHAGPGALLYGGADITCPEKASIKTEYAGCAVSIPAQTSVGGIDYANIGVGANRETRATFDLEGLTYVLTGCSGDSGTYHDGYYTGTSLMSEHRLNGEQVGLWVEQSEPGGNVFRTMQGGVLGGAVSGLDIKAAGFHFQCLEATMPGEAASPEMSAVTLIPSLAKGCTALGIGTAMTPGKCTLSFNAFRTVDIGGTSCASTPISYTSLGCTVKIGPQTGLTTVNYTDAGLGNSHNVPAALEISGLQYTSSSCPVNGTFSDGTITGKVTLYDQVEETARSLTVE